jgi:aspartate aminotransferase
MQKVSIQAETLIGSEIIRLNAEIKQRVNEGYRIYNLTIGDFDPSLFPIPSYFKECIIKAYLDNQTNYPPAEGMQELRTAVSKFMKQMHGLDYSPAQYLIAGGGRPLIYTIYKALLDAGDKVVYPVPSWNNNHYCHLSDAEKVEVMVKPENGFLPTASELEPFVKDAAMIALCSPLNPAGTVMRKDQLMEICDLIIQENKRRSPEKKPLYLLYDQIYSILVSGDHKHYNPVSLCPEMREYTIFVDGISKAFASTGVRIGWSMGPDYVTGKMKSILGHIGAWAPKAEQVGLSHFLSNENEVKNFIADLKHKISVRLNGISEGLNSLRSQGFPVDVISPEGAIYLTAKFALIGYETAAGKRIQSSQDIIAYLLDEAHLAIVPFSAFGASNDSEWFRISIGTIKEEEIPLMLSELEKALSRLKMNTAKVA